jgi:hypothetical protein
LDFARGYLRVFPHVCRTSDWIDHFR